VLLPALRIYQLIPLRLLGRRHMNFVLVTGRTAKPKFFCARCCEPIGASYLREIATRLCYRAHECYAGEGKFAVSILQNHAQAS
jgi:hypothetical protein